MCIYQYKIKTPDCCFFRGTPYGLLPAFLNVVTVAYLSLLIFLFWATFPCEQHSALASHAHEGSHQLSGLAWLLFGAFLLPGCSFLVLLLLYLKCYRFERASLSSGSFYLTLFCHIWCMHWLNLLLSRFPWDWVVLPWGLQEFPQWFAT